MFIALWVAGLVFLLAGLLGIAFGIPVKEFSFGNTEILGGVITACTGMIMLGLWVAVRELKLAGLRSGAVVVAKQPGEVFAPSVATPASVERPDQGSLLFNQPGAISPANVEPPASPSAPLPWHEETATRDRVRGEVAPSEPPASEEAAPAPKRRNLLFSSTSRKERERAEGRTSDAASADLRPAAPSVPPPPKPSESPPAASFEDAWPQSERPRSVDVSRRSGRTPPIAAETAGAVQPPPAPRIEEAPQVTVLKSGVVDGMAYSLYSDGSIEAQMPEGMMRFASIDDLRTHLDQRG